MLKGRRWLPLAAVLAAGCGSARSTSPGPDPKASTVLSALYRLEAYTERFREDRARDAAVGVPTMRPHAVASVDLGALAAGDILLVSSSYMVESRLDGTNIAVATTVYLADHPGGYRDGDREILGVGSPNISNHGDVYPHYGSPSLSGVYRVASEDEGFRYVNLVSWIGTDDRRQAGRHVSLRRGQIDVLHFAQVAAPAHAGRTVGGPALP